MDRLLFNDRLKKIGAADFQVLATELDCQPEDIVTFELDVVDTQPSAIGGALNEFIFSARLDNLCSSFCSLKVSRRTLSSLQIRTVCCRCRLPILYSVRQTFEKRKQLKPLFGVCFKLSAGSD